MSADLVRAAGILRRRLRPLVFPDPVACTYRPLDYAWEPHRLYLEKYGGSPKKTLFLGMNPGPFGMAQTGVPFGEVAAVRDWMMISAPVAKPGQEHPKRPVQGFFCPRSEVSGRRLWGLFAEEYPEAGDFFQDHFVANYCPLVWMSETGANITPDKLPEAAMEPVDTACQEHLRAVISILRPQRLVGVGAYAEKKLREAAGELGLEENLAVSRVLHPSPASPAANRDFAGTARRQLREAGVWEGRI